MDKKIKGGKLIKSFLRGLCFFLILAILFAVANYLTLPRNNTKKNGIYNENAWGFYTEADNSIDTLIIGNSDAYSAFSPLEMWHEYGITSYVSGQGNVMMAEAYYVYLEALKNQNPKVVIIETDAIFPDFSDDEVAINTISDSIYNMFPLFKYHDRWKYVTFDDILNPPNYTWRSYSKGQYISTKIAAYVPEKNKSKENFDKTEIDPFILFYLDMLVNTVRSNNAEVLFVRTPCDKYYVQGKHDIIQKYADAKNIPFIDMDYDTSLAKIDWKKDTRDRGTHLNVDGAKKVSLYIAKYLIDNYHVPDRSGDPELKKAWEEDYKSYQKRVDYLRKHPE